MAKLVNERDRDRRFQIHKIELIEPILRNMVPAHGYPRHIPVPLPIVPPVPAHIVRDEVPEDRHAHLERDREGDVVQHAEAWGEQRDLALGDGAPAEAGGLGELPGKLALFEDGSFDEGYEVELGGDEPVVGWGKWFA